MKTHATRTLAARDLDAVVAIDAALGSGRRRAYFERRLATAQQDPERHLQFAVDDEGALAGFMLGRTLEGEFGRSEPELRLEAFGVKTSAQGKGLGAALGAALEAEARRRSLAAIRTAAGWREHELLRFLDHAGYSLSQSHVLDCSLADIELGSTGENPLATGPGPADPNDYGTPAPGDAESLARDGIEVGLLNEGDLEGVRAWTGATPAAIAAATCAAPCARRSPIPPSAYRSPHAWTAASPATSWRGWTTATSGAPSRPQ